MSAGQLVWFWGGPVAGRQFLVPAGQETVGLPIAPDLAAGQRVTRVAVYSRREWRGGLVEYEFQGLR